MSLVGTWTGTQLGNSPTVPKQVEVTADRLPADLGSQYRTPSGLAHMIALAMISEIEDFASKPPEAGPTLGSAGVPDDPVSLLAEHLAPKGERA
jgi:hypothetical protein